LHLPHSDQSQNPGLARKKNRRKWRTSVLARLAYGFLDAALAQPHLFQGNSCIPDALRYNADVPLRQKN